MRTPITCSNVNHSVRAPAIATLGWLDTDDADGPPDTGGYVCDPCTTAWKAQRARRGPTAAPGPGPDVPLPGGRPAKATPPAAMTLDDAASIRYA